MRTEWRKAPGPAPEVGAGAWAKRVSVAALALGLALSVMIELSPSTWWAGSGLSENPGNFVARHGVDYPVCAPWAGMNADIARRDWHFTEAMSKPIAGGDQTNLGVLLPKTARISKIYCATGAAECSWLHCVPPVTILAMDDVYTRNRTIELTLINKAAEHAAPTGIRVWVVWQ